MADKQMEYTGTGLTVALPDQDQVVTLSKGDKVSFSQYGGEGFFAGRKDFKPVAATAAKTRKGKASNG